MFLIHPLTHFDEEEAKFPLILSKPQVSIWPSNTWKKRRLVPVKAARLLDVTNISSRNTCLLLGAQINSEVKRGLMMGCDYNHPAKDSFHSDVLPPLTPSDRGLLSRWARATNRREFPHAGRRMWMVTQKTQSVREFHVREAETKRDLFLMQVLRREEGDDCFIYSLHYLPREEQQGKDSAALRPAHWLGRTNTHIHRKMPCDGWLDSTLFSLQQIENEATVTRNVSVSVKL